MKLSEKMKKSLTDAGIKFVEVDRKEIARLCQMWPDLAYVAADSYEQVYSVETLDKDLKPMVVYCIEVCN